jgi:hypothetical protein
VWRTQESERFPYFIEKTLGRNGASEIQGSPDKIQDLMMPRSAGMQMDPEFARRFIELLSRVGL